MLENSIEYIVHQNKKIHDKYISKGFKRIATGGASTVYQNGDRVYKVFNAEVFFESNELNDIYDVHDFLGIDYNEKIKASSLFDGFYRWAKICHKNSNTLMPLIIKIKKYNKNFCYCIEVKRYKEPVKSIDYFIFSELVKSVFIGYNDRSISDQNIIESAISNFKQKNKNTFDCFKIGKETKKELKEMRKILAKNHKFISKYTADTDHNILSDGKSFIVYDPLF